MLQVVTTAPFKNGQISRMTPPDASSEGGFFPILSTCLNTGGDAALRKQS